MVRVISLHFLPKSNTVRMSLLVFVSLILSCSYCEVLCTVAPQLARSTSLRVNEETVPANATVSQIEEDDQWKNTMRPEYSEQEAEQEAQQVVQQVVSGKYDSSKRKSKILGSLAFLAGLSVGGLAGAASSSLKTYSKIPEASAALNSIPPKVSPYFAMFYEPYHAYVPHPYLYAPIGLYPLLDPSRLQNTISAVGNQFQQQQQLPSQIASLLDDKQPSDNFLDRDDYVVVEDKRTANESSSGPAGNGNQSNDRNELRAEDDRNAEDKTMTSVPMCVAEIKPVKSRSDPVEEIYVDQDNIRQHKPSPKQRRPPSNQNTTPTTTTTGQTPTRLPPQLNPGGTTANRNSTNNTTQNPMNINNQTTYPPFFGYYGGHPQQIEHIELTTETNDFRQEIYPPINYNLPFDRPANFLPDDKYNYYSYPSVNPYYSNQYNAGPPPEQIPEYFNNNYYRLLNSPDSPPPFDNGFRPVL